VIKKVKLNLSSFAENYRPALWVLLLLLTAIILLFPVNMTFEYYPIQTLYIFDNLALFGAVFYIWLLLLLLLVFSKTSEAKADWEKLALVCISSLVFLAFWVIIIPYGRLDFVQNITNVKYIQQAGTIPVGKAFYLDFPASHLIVLSLAEVTGLSLIQAVNLFLVLNALIFSSLLYVLFSRFFLSSSIAAFAAILIILGNQFLSRGYAFWPGIISLNLLLAFLVVLNRGRYAFLETMQDRLMAVILLAGATAMYFQVSALFFLILVGLYVIQRWAKQPSVAISTIALFIIVPLAWELYWTAFTVGTLVNFGSRILGDIAGGTFMDWFFRLGAANVGEQFPLWANLTRLFWWALIFGPGTVLGLQNLFRLKSLSHIQRAVTGGLLGVIILATITTLATPGGERFVHYLHYAAFFTVPLLMWFLLNLGRRIRQYALPALVVLSLVLSLPTFLVFNNKIGTDTYYSYENAAGEFLTRGFGTGQGLTLANPFPLVRYYVPDVKYSHQMDELTIYGRLPEEEDFWRAIDDMIGASLLHDQYGVTALNYRTRKIAERRLGISPSDPRWQALEDRLSGNLKIYDNGYIQIYRGIE